MVSKSVGKGQEKTVVSKNERAKYGGVLLVFILGVILIGYFSMSQENKEKLIHTATEVQMVFNSYCDISNVEQRKLWIEVVQLGVPEWPDDGICGMIGKHNVEKVVVSTPESVVVKDTNVVVTAP